MSNSIFFAHRIIVMTLERKKNDWRAEKSKRKKCFLNENVQQSNNNNHHHDKNKNDSIRTILLELKSLQSTVIDKTRVSYLD
jgi:hypothetical protein